MGTDWNELENVKHTHTEHLNHDLSSGYAVVQLVETLSCKPEGREFDFRWGRWDFSLI
jgi:hypothetical protein